MNTANHKPGRILGLLFILPFFAYGIGSVLVGSLLESADPLGLVIEHRTRYVAGALLMLLDAVTVVGIGVLFFPIGRRHHPDIALAYVCTRVMEALLLTVGILLLLSILSLGEGAHAPGASGMQELLTLTKLLERGNFWAYQLAMLVLGTGSVAFCVLLFRSGLAPSSLALLGVAGYALLALGCVLELLGLRVSMVLSLPGGLFELVLGGWLMAKGFRPVTRSAEA
ncbi:DUF4386 domain-containing protein [Pyxidicoccus parkwayensis]|uniref:DUF4386 domain-containing protein n=1 Tax=Pyxidicoccus parkwayensis TaxID=2813578 RepID=A0ABX7P8F8_9BACT|nr:DUF4386 domain-containing protein [Pyxidicoccus parkwaysis]QSQ26741.1 DUF4386 domain-containing protein [Pyxidicoccus parkwaysis]